MYLVPQRTRAGPARQYSIKQIKQLTVMGYLISEFQAKYIPTFKFFWWTCAYGKIDEELCQNLQDLTKERKLLAKDSHNIQNHCNSNTN